jgi:hypothetical protein
MAAEECATECVLPVKRRQPDWTTAAVWIRAGRRVHSGQTNTTDEADGDETEQRSSTSNMQCTRVFLYCPVARQLLFDETERN